MYKNTVSETKKEKGVVVRVRRFEESDAEMCLEIASSTNEGVRVLIFPDEELLISWQLRLAALA